ncbi:MAG: hypothetical protein ACRET2_10905, partial [Steroidobacteraceae bacterium]
MNLSPLATGAIGISATGAGAFITWLVSLTHVPAMPEAAAGFLGAMLLAGLHAGFGGLGVT